MSGVCVCVCESERERESERVRERGGGVCRVGMSTYLSNGPFLDRRFIFEDRGFIFEDRGFLIKKVVYVCIFEV